MLNLVLFVFGCCVGVLSGCFGVGGAFILTPTLNALGFPMTTAVGTGLVFTVGVSLIGGVKFFRSGAIPRKMLIRLIFPVAVASLMTLTVAKSLVLRLEMAHSADFYIRSAYIVLLFTAGFMVLHQRKDPEGNSKRNLLSTIPPRFEVGLKGSTVSLWSVLFIGLFVGFLKGFMGVGGGFMLVPLFLVLCGLSAHMAVGASLLVLLISSIYGGGLYLAAGKVEIVPALIMIGGSWFGATLGVKANGNFSEGVLRIYLGGFLILCGVGVVLRSLGGQEISMIYMLSLSLVTTLFVLVKGIWLVARKSPLVSRGK